MPPPGESKIISSDDLLFILSEMGCKDTFEISVLLLG